MIKPVTDPGVTSIDVVFPGNNEVILELLTRVSFHSIYVIFKLWYDIKLMRVFEGGKTKTFTDISLSTVIFFLL
jgi:hypothetical protein